MNYWRCAPENHTENHHIKTIANPRYTKESTVDPHHFIFTRKVQG